jgi:hypothetical protein
MYRQRVTFDQHIAVRMLVPPAHRDIGTPFDRAELLVRHLLGIPIGAACAGSRSRDGDVEQRKDWMWRLRGERLVL